jgi:hypothetical protein
MLDVGAPMFVIIPDKLKAPVFHPGRVIEATEGTFKASFDQLTPPSVGSRICTFSEVTGKFFQQEAIIKEIDQTKYNIIISFQSEGVPTSAEKRASFRIRTSRIFIAGRIADESRCRVMDVSLEGFSAITGRALEVGSLVSIQLVYDTEVLKGQARVQCAKALSNGKHRYGFLVPETNTKMRRSLERITSKVQRVHLRSNAKLEPPPTWWNA